MPLNIEGYKIREQDVRMYEQTNIVRSGLVLHLDASIFNTVPLGSTWYDLSGNGYDAVEIGNGRVSYENSDQAFKFLGGDAVGDGFYIQDLEYVSGSSDQITNMSIDNWIKASSDTNSSAIDQRIILSFDRSAVFRWAIGSDVVSLDGRPSFMFTNSDGTFDLGSTNSPDLRDDQWHHVAVTFESNVSDGVKFYVDGSLVDTNSGNYSPIGNQSESESPRYGSIGTGSELTSDTGAGSIAPVDLFFGYISTLAYYNRALSATEIAHNYNVTKGRFGL